MKDEKKGASALLIGFGKPSGESEPVEEEEGPGELAGKALIKAIKSGNGRSVFEAFESLMRECDEKDSDDEEAVDTEDLTA